MTAITLRTQEAELGIERQEVCRKIGISDATFYVWRKKYGGIGPSELRRLRQLEEENRKLKQIVADLSLERNCPRRSSTSTTFTLTRA